jgi:hypothetical protein
MTESCEVFVKLSCYLLSLLRIHHPDCEHCKAREEHGVEMRKRLEELNWRTQPRSLNNGDRGEVVEVFDSKPAEVVASPPISLEQQKIA